ncbi:hypothetical protein [Bacillus suaedae]|uniref:Uncharacterized protein n=1 Tax=Halalkalibacter suaedae TaxID=2822140 RepID=A0A940WXI3_9BACI|nr:hypothetical protein [Bacillus suaedae]MBP3949659.1 hypothetical protein [Bacillus suaedae]
MIYIFPFVGALVLYFILPLLPVALTKKARYIVILNTLLLTLLYLALVNLGSTWVAIFAVCTLLPLTAYLFFTRVILVQENQTDDVGFSQIERHETVKDEKIENEVEVNYIDEVEVEAEHHDIELEELEEETFLQEEVNLDLTSEIPVLDHLAEIPKEDITEELVEDEINEVSNSFEEDSESEDEFDFLLRKREVPKKREVVDLTDGGDSEDEQLFENREQLFAEVEDEGILLKEEQEGIPLSIDVPTIAKNVVETEEKSEENVINPNQVTFEEIDDLVNDETVDATEEETEVLEELKNEETDSDVRVETRPNEAPEKLEDTATADETDIDKSSLSNGTEAEGKRMDSGILSLVLKELTWIKKQNGEELYEQTLLGNLQNKLHPRDYYLFASLLRDLYISQQDYVKLKNLMLDLRERYVHQPVLLEEINYYLNQIQ